MIQIIMASRVLYGMGQNQLAPTMLAYVHPRTRTPLLATGLVTLTVLILALWLPLVTLAQLTSLVTLLIFTSINLALITLKRRTTVETTAFTTPIWLPWTGAGLCLLLLFFQAVSLIG